MKDDSLDYKFVFVAVIIAYFIAQFVFAYFKPELTRYSTVLEILFFVIPIIIINENKSLYKINKFHIAIIPVILWALFGITLFEMGMDIVIKHILPDFILTQYNNFYNYYSMEVNNLIINRSNTAMEFFIITSCVAIVPAVCEEFLFRVYLMQKIMQNNTPTFAITISALLFAIIHLNPVAFIYIFVLGLFLGILFYKTHSIIPSIILHFLNNFIVILSINYYNGSELDTSTLSIWFGIILTFIGVVTMLLSNKFVVKVKN